MTVALQPEALPTPVPDRPEVGEPAAVQQPLVVVAGRAGTAVVEPVPMVHAVAVMQAGPALVLEVVALAAVDRMPQEPLVLQVVVPAVDLVS